MKVFKCIIGLCILALLAAFRGGLTTDQVLPTYTGLVATRGYIGVISYPSFNYVMARSGSYSRTAISSMQIVIPAWYIDQGTHNETPAGADVTVTASIEYPAGVITQVQFSGSSTGTVTNGSQLVSDSIGVIIPANTQFWIRIWEHLPGAAGMMAGTNQNTTIGDSLQCSATPITDLTGGGTISNTCSSPTTVLPVAIIGATSKASVCIWGDSRAFGSNDTTDISGDVGNTARSIGQTFGYMNFSTSGYTPLQFLNSHALTLAVSNSYCTHVVVEQGFNSLINGVGPTETRLAAMWALWGKKIYQNTLEPDTTSTDNYTTLVNQTPFASEATRLTVNAWIRGVPAGVTGIFDVASAVESSLNSGLWKVDGTPNKYIGPNQGIHETQAGYLLIVSANVIPASTFTWP